MVVVVGGGRRRALVVPARCRRPFIVHVGRQSVGTARLRHGRSQLPRQRLQHTHTHTRLTARFPGLPGPAGTRKVKVGGVAKWLAAFVA